MLYPMDFFFNCFFKAIFAFFVPFTVMVAFLLMPLNAFLLMVFSFPAVTVIFFRFLQPENASLPIFVTLLPIVTVKVKYVTYKVTAVSDKAFKGNKKLTTVTIGSNVTKIGKEAFSGCKNLKKITVTAGN